MLLPDEDVGYGRLAGYIGERGLDRGAIVNLVQLNGVKFCSLIREQLLRGAAVGAVGLAKDGDGVLVNDGLDLCLCGGHCGGAGGAREERAEERNGCGFVCQRLLRGMLAGCR